MAQIDLPLLGITAWSGTGKTTLLKQLIPQLRKRGIRVGMIKHTHHNMDVDKPGKDSYELRKAGADQTLVASQQRWALMTETPEQSELDLILVEGFKGETIPKIALYRHINERNFNDLLDEHVIAVASDCDLSVDFPLLDINAPEAIAEFIVDWLKRTK